MTSRIDWVPCALDCRICGSSDTVRSEGVDRIYCRECEFLDLVGTSAERS